MTARPSGIVAWSWIAEMANAAGAVALAGGSAWTFRHARHGLAAAHGRGQYAGGMLVASLGLAAGVIALVLAVLALGCWLVRRRVHRNAAAGASDVMFLCAASAPALLAAAFALSR